MSNHTLSPWLLSDTDKRFVYALNEYGTNVFQAHVCGPNTKPEELEANARLIAAAPELLEALETLLADVDDHQEDCPQTVATDEVLTKVRAAIAKGRSESC